MTDMDRQRILKKIKQLLAIGERSPYQHEAETAIATAQRMLLRYNLSLEEVTDAEVDRQWANETVWQGAGRSAGQNYVEALLSTYFFVEVLRLRMRDQAGRWKRETIVFGETHNVAVARYVFVYLMRTFRDLVADYLRRTRQPRSAAADFLAGLRDGLRIKLQEERRVVGVTKDAPIVSRDRLRDAVAREMGCGINTFTPRETAPKSRHAYYSGVEQGRAIAIRKPLPAGESGPRGYIGEAP